MDFHLSPSPNSIKGVGIRARAQDAQDPRGTSHGGLRLMAMRRLIVKVEQQVLDRPTPRPERNTHLQMQPKPLGQSGRNSRPPTRTHPHTHRARITTLRGPGTKNSEAGKREESVGGLLQILMILYSLVPWSLLRASQFSGLMLFLMIAQKAGPQKQPCR